MDDIPCPICPLGESEHARGHLHCAICGHYEKVEDDEDD
jgi:uncharacterized Zn finger protein (UPF0148 family)